MSESALPHDPLWPRAGGWPAASEWVGRSAADAWADVGILGVPTHATSLSPTSADVTPAAVRAALRRYSPTLAMDRSVRHPIDPDELDLDRRSQLDFGDVHEPDGADGAARVIAAVADALEHVRLLVALGGDNALTFPVALGAWGAQLPTAGLITLDAHHDLRDGESNGSPVRQLLDAGFDGRRIVQVGIADFANSRAYERRALDAGITIIHRDELHRRPLHDVMAEALHIAGAGGGPIHVDLDLDVCDRSVVPACPASVPGGIAAWELRAAARLAASDPRVRSMDIAEVDAGADAPDGRTVRLAALCVLEATAGFALR
ncbi:arginase family protein [Rathayibacter sp. YIM 133350]|uniref:arginase family protein n=1 Tax=Rathayibacter sp. YIM 133350 TaxID=3131992 RepID=UPI00307D3E80